MAPITGTFSLVSVDDLLPVIEKKPLGDSSLNLKLASGQIKSAAHLGGGLPVDFTFHVGGAFSVTALNGKSGLDDGGVVGVQEVKTPAGEFRPPLRFDATHGWLKYTADADVKADVAATAGIVAFTGGAGRQVVMSDYHRHALGDDALAAVGTDLKVLRSAAVLNHLQNLPEGDALAFQTRGELTASIEIEWSDVFTSEISSLARLLKSVAPIAIRTTVGATCTVNVSVADSFSVVFARPVGGRLVVAVRKSHVKQVDASAGAKISAEIAHPSAVDAVINDVVAGLLGTAADRLTKLLDNLAARALTADDNALAASIVDRLKLTGVSEIAKAVANLTAEATARIRAIVEAKVEVSFAYEYSRVSSDVSVFEAEIPDSGPGQGLHAELMGGNLAAAFQRKPTEIALRRFLNETSTTVTKAWGFTLGLNKWKLFGQDRRQVVAVERVDRLAGTVSRSYVGSGGYARNKLAWTVDFAADMPAARVTPLVGDYQFGLHIAMIRDEQTFDADDLETALDFAGLWSICPETSLSFVRKQLAGVVNQKAEWSFHLRVNDEALRPIVRVLGSMAPRDFAGAAAAALDATVVPSMLQRRATYEPLWQALLSSAEAFNVETVRLSADTLLKNPDLANRERNVIRFGVFDQSAVASIVAADTEWFADCARFTRGCRLLADAIAIPTPDAGKLPDVYDKLVRFWTQSHYVRTLGAALVDVARSVGQFKGLERSLNLTSGATTVVVSSNQF